MEGGAEVTSISPEQQVSSQEKRLDERSWQEIRDFYARTPYTEVIAAGIERIKQWEATPRVSVSEVEWNRTADEQLQKTQQLVKDNNIPGVVMNETDVKANAVG